MVEQLKFLLQSVHFVFQFYTNKLSYKGNNLKLLYSLIAVSMLSIHNMYTQPTNNINCNEVVNAQIDQTVKRQMVMQNIPGVAVGFFKNGKIIHLKGYGFQDIEKKKPITIETIMHWASVSKSVTAVAALQLQEDPTIDFDLSDLVTKHCSYWPSSVNYIGTNSAGQSTNGTDNRHAQVRIRHLLQNRSGINHYGRGKNSASSTLIAGNTVNFSRTGPYQADDDEYNASSAVNIFSGSVLAFNPGSDYLYSTYGHNLAGAAIEEASPNGYVTWVMDNIADVMDLESLQVANEENRDGHDMPSDGILKVIEDGNKESVLPGGGWESNICDFTKYAIGLASDQYYDVTKDSIWNASNRTSFASGNSYSYGVWYTGSNSNLRVWHGGKHSNMRTLMHFFPSDTTGVVIMSPVEYSNLPLLQRHIYDAINERDNLYGGQKHTPLDKCRVDMKDGNDRFNAVWRKTGNDVIIRTGRTHSEFYEELKRLRGQGYICKDIEPFLHEGEILWDGVFQKNIPETKIWRNASKDRFVDKCEEMRRNGFRLMDVETYKNSNGRRLWAGLFRKTNDGYAVRLDRLTEEFASIRQRENERGKKLIDIEVYTKNGKLYWSGVFTQGTPNQLNRNYTVAEFNDLVSERRNNGYKLIDIEHYTIKRNGRNQRGVAGIWERSTKTEKRRTNNKFCSLMDFHESFSNSGYELIDFERMAR